MLFKCSIIIYFYKDVSKSCIPPTMDLLIIFTNHDDSLPHNEETKSYLSDIIYKVIFYFQTLIFLILQKNYFISIYFFNSAGKREFSGHIRRLLFELYKHSSSVHSHTRTSLFFNTSTLFANTSN